MRSAAVAADPAPMTAEPVHAETRPQAQRLRSARGIEMPPLRGLPTSANAAGYDVRAARSRAVVRGWHASSHCSG